MIKDIRNKKEPKILAIGNHPGIIQSILDFDYMSGKSEASIVGIITGGRSNQIFFWGEGEIFITCYKDIQTFKKENDTEVDFMLNLSSGRRVLQSTNEFFDTFPDAIGGHVFAEDTPEKYSLELYDKYGASKLIAGPSGVGMILPGIIKLGAIGGTDVSQLINNRLFSKGNVAVISASGGMTNEFINIVVKNDLNLSFALSVGGDRFPITSVTNVFLYAESDPDTEVICYYGELGGQDEYEIIELINQKKLTKPVIAYIAGVISDAFDKPVQFGHAKALAGSKDEGAKAKMKAMSDAGVMVGETFEGFVNHIKTIKKKLKGDAGTDENVKMINSNRKHSLFRTTIGDEDQRGYVHLDQPLSWWVENKSYSEVVISTLLGHQPKSKLIAEFTETILKTLVDHGINVSGAINTSIAARAGKDLVSSLASGLLTIGPSFGGAITLAARQWLEAVESKTMPKDYVEALAARKEIIPGVGHRKYRIGFPDPRIKILEKYLETLKDQKYYSYAKEVELITSSKKGNLILNVDGAVAAILLDILTETEDYSTAQLKQLIEIDFFNAFFILARAVGFTGHYLDQRRMDEGLFRMPDDMVGRM